LFEGQAQREQSREDFERRIQQVWTQANSEVGKAQGETSDSEDRLVHAKVRISELETEVEVAKDALFDSQAQRERLREDSERRIQHVWTQANSEVLKAQGETSDVEDHLVKARARLSELEDDVRRMTENLMTAEQESERVQQESDQHLQEVWRSANAQTLAAQSATQDVRNELGVRLARIEELEGELKAKEEALASAQWDRNQAHQDAGLREQHFTEVITAAGERAAALVSVATERSAAQLEQLQAQLGKSSASVEELEFEVGELRADVEKKVAELSEYQARGARLAELEAEAARHVTALESQEQKLARQAGKLDELNFEVTALNQEVAKKTDELLAAHAQRDAAHKEKAALEAFLASGSAEEGTELPAGEKPPGSDIPSA
jgi:chromosome segregation ATPase